MCEKDTFLPNLFTSAHVAKLLHFKANSLYYYHKTPQNASRKHSKIWLNQFPHT